MRPAAAVLVVMCTLPSMIGCGAEPQQPGREMIGGLAVVDLDAVARRLGRDVEMKEAVEQQEAALNEQLSTLKTSLQARYDETRKQIGDEPSDKQRTELKTLENQMNVQLAQSKQQALAALNAHQQKLIAQFREEVKPVARAVAAERGLSVVVPKNEGLLLSFEPAVEITDRVAEKLKAQAPAPPAERLSKAREADKR